MAKRSKKNPNLEGTVVTVVVGDSAEEEDVESFLDTVEGLADDFDGVNVHIGYASEGAEESEEEDEEEEEEEAEEEEDEEEEEEEEEEEVQTFTEKQLVKKSNDALKELLEYWEVELPGRFSQKKAVAAILEAQEEWAGEEEEEEEEEDEEELDEEVLLDPEQTTMAKLRTIYKDVVKKAAPKSYKREKLVDAILDAAEEE